MSDFNFNNVAAHEVDTARVGSLTLYDIELLDAEGDPHSPTLHGVCAGEKNKKLRALVNKANAKRGGRGYKNSAGKILKAARENTREFFPSAVFTGWDDVYNASGESVGFSVEAATAFLAALPDHLMQGVMEYFGDPVNFSGAGIDEDLTGEDVKEAAGN